MRYLKKSLGQNFLIDRNIINKIINLVDIKDKDIIEIGPGQGALTDEILRKKPKSLSIIEKDSFLFKKLSLKYANNNKIKIFHSDILKFDIEKVIKKETNIFGNLPYNISSQILIKFIKLKKWPPKFKNIIFMFQKELGEKILGNFSSNNYGRLSIISNYRLNPISKFLVSPNCFFPKPKVNSLVIHFQPKDKNQNIKDINNLEKITNLLFSSKRKIIKKKIEKILSYSEIKKIRDLKLNKRPSEIKPEAYYKITELFEKD